MRRDIPEILQAMSLEEKAPLCGRNFVRMSGGKISVEEMQALSE